MRHGTGLPPTHVFIVRLVRLIIETGGLTGMCNYLSRILIWNSPFPKAIMAILHACLYVSKSEFFVIPGVCMSKIYAITMLVIFNNRIKISGGRFGQEEDEESTQTRTTLSTTGTSREQRRESRDSRTTKIFVSNGRLTFQLASDVPPSPSVESNPGSNLVRNVC